MKVFSLVLFFCLFQLLVIAGPPLKPMWSKRIGIPEPSDISINKNNQYYIVSDHGILFETDSMGRVLKTADDKGLDFEGVLATDSTVYVMDESLRRVSLYRSSDLKLISTKTLQYSGARNRGFESLSWNPHKKCFVACTEKAPCLLMEFDEQFQVLNERELKGIPEVSAATWHADHLWLLSDELRTVFKVSATDYSVLDSWKVPVINPEGISFNATGDLLILSDDRATLYCFSFNSMQP